MALLTSMQLLRRSSSRFYPPSATLRQGERLCRRREGRVSHARVALEEVSRLRLNKVEIDRSHAFMTRLAPFEGGKIARGARCRRVNDRDVLAARRPGFDRRNPGIEGERRNVQSRGGMCKPAVIADIEVGHRDDGEGLRERRLANERADACALAQRGEIWNALGFLLRSSRTTEAPVSCVNHAPSRRKFSKGQFLMDLPEKGCIATRGPSPRKERSWVDPMSVRRSASP